MAAVDKKRRIYRKYNDNSHPVVKAQNRGARNELGRARRKFENKLADNIRTDTKSFLLTSEVYRHLQLNLQT